MHLVLYPENLTLCETDALLKILFLGGGEGLGETEVQF